MYSRIIGTGSYLPARTLTNFDLEKIVETSHDWIVSRSVSDSCSRSRARTRTRTARS